MPVLLKSLSKLANIKVRTFQSSSATHRKHLFLAGNAGGSFTLMMTMLFASCKPLDLMVFKKGKPEPTVQQPKKQGKRSKQASSPQKKEQENLNFQPITCDECKCQFRMPYNEFYQHRDVCKAKAAEKSKALAIAAAEKEAAKMVKEAAKMEKDAAQKAKEAAAPYV